MEKSLPYIMNAAIADGFGTPDVLKIRQIPLPKLRPTDVLVKVISAGINRAEILWREGKYGSNPGFGDCDEIIGLEIAGIVVDFGDQVKDIHIGQLVMGLVGGGGYAQYARMDYRLCMDVPENINAIEAGGIPECMITAHQMLMHLGKMKKGERVLIHGAGGGVGTSMIQMAKEAGASWIGATASKGKHEKLKALGVDFTIDYTCESFKEIVHNESPGGKVDIIICNMGGSYFENNIFSLDNFGRLIQLGLQDGNYGKIPIDLVLRNCLSIHGSVMKSQTIHEKQAMTKRFTDRWMSSLKDGKIKPIIDEFYPLNEVVDAHIHFQNEKPFGKIILNCV